MAVVKVINQNKRQMAYTLLLIIITVYIYAFIAFLSLQNSYVIADYGYCDSLVVCFTTTLTEGIRSYGGIGDFLT